MTPFDAWYAREVEAKLPADFPEQLRVAGKNEAAKVWNAALEAVKTHQSENGSTMPFQFTLRILRVK
jgi:hypothetical protein